MVTLFDIDDEIEVKLKGRIESFSISKNGDCYVIKLLDVNPEGSKIYLDSIALSNATKTKKDVSAGAGRAVK